MGNPIHARLRSGEWQYRIWSTQTDSYITPLLSEQELRDAIADNYTAEVKAAGLAELDITKRIARARKRGSSAITRAAVDTAGPWEAELNPDSCVDAPPAPDVADKYDRTNDELLHENNRLRAMLNCLSQAGLGKSGCVDIVSTKNEGGAPGLRLVITRADADERAFMDLVAQMIEKAVAALAPAFSMPLKVDTNDVNLTGTSATSTHDGKPMEKPKRPVKDYLTECDKDQMVITATDSDGNLEIKPAKDAGPGVYRAAADAIGFRDATVVLEQIASDAGLSPTRALDPVLFADISELQLALNACTQSMARFIDAGFDVVVKDAQ